MGAWPSSGLRPGHLQHDRQVVARSGIERGVKGTSPMGIVRWIGRGLALGGAVAAGGALFVTARHVLTTPQPLRSGLEGDAKIDRKHGGDLYYTVAGPEDALPVVLV